MGVPGPVLDDETRDTIRDVQPSGFILFSRNIKEPAQLRALTDELRTLVRHEPVITIDQEGGRVSRLRELGSEPPSAKQLREKGDLGLIRRHGALTGKLLRLFGFNLDLCPVLDLSFAGDERNSLKNRTWGETPDEVAKNARAFAEAMRAEGVLSCAKHFPGYSRAAIDPHHEMPRIHRSRAELEAEEWVPFRRLLDVSDTQMIGHAFYPSLEPEPLPSTLSGRIINGILRRELGFRGAVISDDIDMGALIHFCGLKESVRRAIAAGNDLLLLCHRVAMAREAAAAAAELPDEITRPALDRIETLRRRLAAPSPFSLEAFCALDSEVRQLRVETLGAAEADSRSEETAARSPVELY